MSVSRRSAFASCIALLALLGGCGGGGDDAAQVLPGIDHPPKLQQLRIVDGQNYATGQSAVADFTPTEISSVVTWSDGRIASQFKAPISAADFASLSQLVESADLAQTLAFNSGIYAPCRREDSVVSLTRSDIKYSFTIPGGQQCGGAVNPAFAKLRALTTDLLIKYAPKAG